MLACLTLMPAHSVQHAIRFQRRQRWKARALFLCMHTKMRDNPKTPFLES
jgi:hypothetical protein